MSLQMSDPAKALLELIDVKAPLSVTEDGSYALTLGVAALNVGIRVGGNTGVELFAEFGPAYVRAGVTQDVGLYAVAGHQALSKKEVPMVDENNNPIYDENGNQLTDVVGLANEVGVYVGMDGFLAYADFPSFSMLFDYFGVMSFTGEGMATFRLADDGYLKQTTGTLAAAEQTARLLGVMDAYKGPASLSVPGLVDLFQDGGFFGAPVAEPAA